MITWFKETFPSLCEFFRNFFKALDNRLDGHSLRKWLAVGFFWLICEAVLRFTDTSNLVAVIGVLSGMITTLVVTYTVGNYHERKLNTPIPESTPTPPTDESAG